MQIKINENNPLRITVSGSGSARLSMELRWNRKAVDDEICPFELDKPEIGPVNLKYAGNAELRNFDSEQ